MGHVQMGDENAADVLRLIAEGRKLAHDAKGDVPGNAPPEKLPIGAKKADHRLNPP